MKQAEGPKLFILPKLVLLGRSSSIIGQLLHHILITLTPPRISPCLWQLSQPQHQVVKFPLLPTPTSHPPTHPKETPPIPNPDPIKLRLRRQQSVAGDGQELTQNKL